MPLKISQLPSAIVPLTGAELILLVQGGITKQTPSQSIIDAATTAASNWAQYVGGDVPGAPAGSRSSKSWAQDALISGTYGGSAKDWAQSTGLPDGVSKSAKSYAADAGTSATAAGAYAASAASTVKFFTTIALGNAGVADAASFGVEAGGSDGLTRPTIYQRVSAGVSLLIGAWVTGAEYDTLFPSIGGVSPVYGVKDDRGNALTKASTDGSLTIGNVIALQTNGLDQRFRLRQTSLGNFDAERVTFILDGQSNAQGRAPGITAGVEFDNIGFAPQASGPGAYFDLNVANCSVGGVQESLIFGALGFLKKLILFENGLSATDIGFQMLGADNSQGSTAIAAHAKGSQYYGYGTSQATSAVTLSATDNKSVIHGGVFWNQGEADSATPLATYQAALQLLATNYNTDLKGITGQTKDITLLTAQTTSNTANRNVALAQLAAANASALVKCIGPMYQFDYEADGIHVINRHDYWLGAYYALVWKRIWVDLLTWKPTQPISAQTIGNISYVTYDCMVQPLVLDTTGVPAQTNSGFTLASGNTINSVSVVRPNVVKIVGAGALAGQTLNYGFGAATGKGGYTGAAGNLRDSQGFCVPTPDTLGNWLMHNWCNVSQRAL